MVAHFAFECLLVERVRKVQTVLKNFVISCELQGVFSDLMFVASFHLWPGLLRKGAGPGRVSWERFSWLRGLDQTIRTKFLLNLFKLWKIIKMLDNPRYLKVRTFKKITTRLRKVGTVWTPYFTMSWFHLRRAEGTKVPNSFLTNFIVISFLTNIF